MSDFNKWQLKEAHKEIATLRMVINHYGDVESENDELFEQLKEANEVIDTLWENEPEKTEMLDILQEYKKKWSER